MQLHHSSSSTCIEAGKVRRMIPPAFTLVEVVVVIAFITILLAVGVPLLSDPANSGRKATKEILRAHLQQARAHSIATGTLTSVLFPDYAADSKAGGALICIAEVESQPDPSAPYKVTKQVQRWTQLPENIFFFNQTTTQSSHKTIMDGTMKIEASYQKNSVKCHYVVFAPNGQITSPPFTASVSKLVVACGKGFLRSAAVTPTQKNKTGIVFDLLQINRLNARARDIDP